MAAFTDQFTRHSPFKIPVGLLFNDRLGIAISSAIEVLGNRTVDELTRIAQDVSGMIDAAAMEYGRDHTEHYAEMWPELSPADLQTVQDDGARDVVDQLREDLGEFGIFMFIEADKTRHDGTEDGVAFERQDALAVLALWLAVDCVDLVAASTPPGSWDRWVNPKQYGSAAAVLAMDSMGASILAVEARERAVDRIALEAEGVRAGVLAEIVKRDEALRQDRSDRGLAAAEARWEPKKLHEAEAVKIAKAGSFPSYAEAIRKIQANVMKVEGGHESYGHKTILKWLKAADWEPPEKG